jgi:hypothetical protein
LGGAKLRLQSNRILVVVREGARPRNPTRSLRTKVM